ncbi:MAG: hypothetical protein P8107_13455 [Spirochaetia bacterium]
MGFSTFLSSPYTWLVIAAFLTGAALSRLLRWVKRSDDPARAGAHKRSTVLLLFGRFLQDPMGLLLFYLIASGIFFLALRFKKLFGIPFAVLFILLVIAVFLFLQAVVAFTGETEIARVKVDTIRNNIIKYELMPAVGEPETVVTEGVNFAPQVELIIFNDFFVFLGAKTWYRFDAMLSYNPAKSSATEVSFNRHPLSRPQGLSEDIFAFFMQHRDAIPGIKTIQGQITYPLKVTQGRTYSITVQNDGGVEVREVR